MILIHCIAVALRQWQGRQAGLQFQGHDAIACGIHAPYSHDLAWEDPAALFT